MTDINLDMILNWGLNLERILNGFDGVCANVSFIIKEKYMLAQTLQN